MSTIQQEQMRLEAESKGPEAPRKAENREKTIIRTSIIGILANLFLASFKAIIGMLSRSIAIVLDAVNNLSDAGSSLITIIGTKLASRNPDRKHPFGYGRIEYFSAMIISVIILYAGITSLVESVKKIISPDTPDYSPLSLIIVAAAVGVKLVLGHYVKKTGERVHSDSLVNSGQDATFDAVISASTLVAALLFVAFGVSLEAWLGAVISLFIIKSGVEMLMETLSRILGERADADLARGIKETVLAFPNVSGVYDLVLHNYGPDAYNGSLHIEVPENMYAGDLDQMLREITLKIYEKYHVILTAVGIYALNNSDPKAVAMREQITRAVLAHDYILQVHGFNVNEKSKTIRFDVIVSFDAPDRQVIYQHILKDVAEMYPDYTAQVVLDTDFSES